MTMHPNQLSLLHRLRAAAASGGPLVFGGPEQELSVERYTGAEQAAKEVALLQQQPLVVAHAAELSEVGTCITREDAGVPLLLARGPDGKVRCFRNACRHRGAQLLVAAAPCRRKAIVCPYHAWTYDLQGALVHVPLRQAFPTMQPADRGLVELRCTERHGLIWVTVDPTAPHDVDAFVGELADELTSLQLRDHVVYRRVERECECNWKFLIDAFLENYHVRRLHRRTVGEFFLDSVSVFDQVGPHMRTATARRALLDPPDPAVPPTSLMTMSYHVFPFTMFIVHPGFISRLNLLPVAVDRMRFVHEMLIPAAGDTEAKAEHWARSFELIDGGVFSGEDIMIAQSAQRGLGAQANETFLFGGLEAPAVAFHQMLERVLAASPGGATAVAREHDGASARAG